MTTRPTKRKQQAETGVRYFNPYGEDINKVLDEVEKRVGLSDSSMNKKEKRMPTGQLMQDIMLGGGITAGWYTNFGQEQSCKTTDAVAMMLSAVKHGVPIIALYDYEGSGEPNYIESMMDTAGVAGTVEDLFGVKDNKGNWITPPRVRYRTESVAEKFFDFLASLQRRLPDKRLMNDQWYYVYEDSKVNRKVVGDQYDKSYLQKTGKLRVKAEDGRLQAFIVVDSYPAMLPERMDVDDPSNAMAVQARMFSDQLKRVKGKMKGKRIAVVGINQLRLRPGVSFGNPEYEPCGEAIKLYSDCRMRHASRAISAVDGAKGKGQIEEEASLGGGKDTYRYIHVRAIKNKLSVPYLEAFFRLWITDENGVARGFDPVYDTYSYLLATGQLEGKRPRFTLKFEGNEAKKAIDWMTFKALILSKDKAEIKAICLKLGMKPMLLRKQCEKQMASGRGLDMFFEKKKAGDKGDRVKASAKPDAEDSDDSDDE